MNVPKYKRLIPRCVGRARFLREVLQRLDNEVGGYLLFLREKQTTDPLFPKVGFWAGIRLLMPVVESTARAEGLEVQSLLRCHLGIAAPYLVWDMYRNALLHNDEMQSARDAATGKMVCWGISLGGGHRFGSGCISIDVFALYSDLRVHLAAEAAKGDQTPVAVVDVVEYNVGGPSPAAMAARMVEEIGIFGRLPDL